MADDVILLEKWEPNEHIVVLTLNRPDAGNALNTPMLEAMAEKLDEVDADTSIRVLIMRSAGPNSSFGADLNELVVKKGDGYKNMTKKDAKKHIDDGRVVAKKLFHLRVPTIGIIHGFCLGGGAELYTLCDVLCGASGGKDEGGLMYGFPEPTIGAMAGWMGPELLIKRIGVGYAKDILLSGRMVNGDEAFYMGLVQALLPKDELFERALQWADMIVANAPLAVESTRRTLNRVMFPDFDEVVATTGSETVENLMTKDFVKGATKILERSKEQPKYERR
ncbi:MAG: enoyl-CoA hydratase/isomerase family protein [Candidatus Latescibacterota bacterium]|nr:MAG: enoyl-CoA hydratase/isomerase family protein [Candidatus Latescibacterota bacterium]